MNFKKINRKWSRNIISNGERITPEDKNHNGKYQVQVLKFEILFCSMKKSMSFLEKTQKWTFFKVEIGRSPLKVDGQASNWVSSRTKRGRSDNMNGQTWTVSWNWTTAVSEIKIDSWFLDRQLSIWLNLTKNELF